MKFAASLALMGVLFRAQSCVAEETIDSAVRDQLKATFARLDINKDGAWSNEELQKELHTLDANGNGYIEWSEGLNDMENNPNEPFSNFGPSSIMEAMEKDAFKCLAHDDQTRIYSNWTFADLPPSYDANHDGATTEEEFINYHSQVFLRNVKGMSDKCP